MNVLKLKQEADRYQARRNPRYEHFAAEMRPLHLDEVRACLDARAVHRVDYHVAP